MDSSIADPPLRRSRKAKGSSALEDDGWVSQSEWNRCTINQLVEAIITYSSPVIGEKEHRSIRRKLQSDDENRSLALPVGVTAATAAISVSDEIEGRRATECARRSSKYIVRFFVNCFYDRLFDPVVDRNENLTLYPSRIQVSNLIQPGSWPAYE